MANRKAQIDKENKDEPDRYDEDLKRDNRRAVEGSTEREPSGGATREPSEAERQFTAGAFPEHDQKDRKGQAQSPVELSPNQPPKQQEGHGG